MRIFDAHFHIIEPNFPLKENNGYLPKYFTTKMYLDSVAAFGIKGGAIVSGSFQALDQEYLKHALNELGSNYVGVVNLDFTASDKEVIELYNSGVRGARFNIFRGGAEKITQLLKFARRIYDLCGMHVELYIDGEQIEQYFDILAKLPKASIDHLGMSIAGFKCLQKLAERGVHIKASGFMRVNFDVSNALQSLYSINPNSLMFGTDLPGTRASRTFNEYDLSIIRNNFATLAQNNILFNNATSFYGVTVS